MSSFCRSAFVVSTSTTTMRNDLLRTLSLLTTRDLGKSGFNVSLRMIVAVAKGAQSEQHVSNIENPKTSQSHTLTCWCDPTRGTCQMSCCA